MNFVVMDKEHTLVRMLLLVLLIMVWFCVYNGNTNDEAQKMKPSSWECQRLRRSYSTGWYNTLKHLCNHSYVVSSKYRVRVYYFCYKLKCISSCG